MLGKECPRSIGRASANFGPVNQGGLTVLQFIIMLAIQLPDGSLKSVIGSFVVGGGQHGLCDPFVSQVQFAVSRNGCGGMLLTALCTNRTPC